MGLVPRALLIAVAIAVVYGRAVSFDFVWDDDYFLLQNEAIKDLSHVPAFFSQGSDGLYRPLRMTLYAISYAAFGLNPAPYHALALLLHLLVSLLLLRILDRCGASKNAALLAALVFALHPVHIEKILFITSAFDLPGDLCVLAALWLYLRSDRSSRVAWAASLLMFGVGLFFAENAAVYPLLWGLVEFMGKGAPREARQKKIAYAIALLLIFVFYVAVRMRVLGQLSRPPSEPHYWATQSVMMTVYLVYWRLLLIPYPLSPVPPIEGPIVSFCAPCAFAAILSAAVIFIAFGLRRELPLLALGLLWFYVDLLPNSNIVPTGTLMAERYLYLPSAGLSFLAAALLSRAGRLRTPVSVCVLTALAVLSAYQAGTWRDDESLWTHAIAMAPRSELAWSNLGVFYRERGRRADAIALYRRMLANGLSPHIALSELAAFAIDSQNYEVAEGYLTQLAQVAPADASFAENLVVAHCQLNRPGWQEEAQRTLQRFPTAFLFEQVGNCFARVDQREQALSAFLKALERKPGSAEIKGKIAAVQGLPSAASTGGNPVAPLVP